MDVFHGKNDFCDIEAGFILIEDLPLIQMESQVTSGTVIQDHIEILRSLEGVVKLDDVGVVRELEDVALCDGISEVIVLHKESLLEDLHSKLVTLRLILSLDFEHFTKGALAKDIKYLE